LVQLAGEGGEGPALQGRRGEVQLQVEPVDLQHHPRVGRLGPDRLVARQRPGLAVDQEQLQLRPDRGRTGPEAGALQQPVQGEQALVEAPLEAAVIHRVEPITVDGKAHLVPPASDRRSRPRRRGLGRGFVDPPHLHLRRRPLAPSRR
jgi:hypothetical protein